MKINSECIALNIILRVCAVLTIKDLRTEMREIGGIIVEVHNWRSHTVHEHIWYRFGGRKVQRPGYPRPRCCTKHLEFPFGRCGWHVSAGLICRVRDALDEGEDGSES